MAGSGHKASAHSGFAPQLHCCMWGINEAPPEISTPPGQLWFRAGRTYMNGVSWIGMGAVETPQ